MLTTVCLLLSFLQPLVQTYPTWYHHNGQYDIPDYSSRRNVHYLQEDRPVHTPNVEYRLHRGYPQWDLPYDTAEEPVVNIPLLNSINQRLSAYMQTSSQLRDRLAAMGWHGEKSAYHHRYPYRPKVPFIRPSQVGHDRIRPQSPINPHQQTGVFDNGLEGGRKILGSLPHYLILEATPANKRPGVVPKYDIFGEREKHRPLITTAVPKLSTEISQEKATQSTANTSSDWKLGSSESPKFDIETTTSRTSTQSTVTSPSTVPGTDSGRRGQEVKNYTVVHDKILITATPTTPVDFAEETEKSILENSSAIENPHIPIISLSGEDLKLIETLKPVLHEEDEDNSGFISKGESIYIDFPEADYGKNNDGQNVKEGGNEQDNTLSGILKLLKGLSKNDGQDFITPRKYLINNKPGRPAEGRTEVSTVYYDNVNEDGYENSRGIVLIDGVKLSTAIDEPTTVTFRSDTEYEGHKIGYNTESATVLNYDELASENATKHITTSSNTEPTSTFSSELGVSKEFGSPIATMAFTETITEISTVGHDTRTEPWEVTTLEDVTVTDGDLGRVGQEEKTVPSGITVPEDVTVTTEPYSQERSPQLNEGPFTEDGILTTERHNQGQQERTRLDEATVTDVRITTERDEDLGTEGETELIGVIIMEEFTVSTELSDHATQDGRTLAEDLEVNTEPYIVTMSTPPQQPKEGNEDVEYDEDLNTTINYANEFTTNVVTEYTTEFISQGKSVEHTTQKETEGNDGNLIMTMSNNETAHGEGTVDTTEYFTSTLTHGTIDSVTEITEPRDGEATIDIGDEQNFTPNDELSTDLPQTIVTDQSPDDQDVELISITREMVETTTAVNADEEIDKHNAETMRAFESTSQMVPTTFKNLTVEYETGSEYLTEIYTTVKESTGPFYEETDSTAEQFTHETLVEREGTAHFTEDDAFQTASYPTTYPGSNVVYDEQPTSTLAFTKYLTTEEDESSTERESKELILSNGLTGEEDNTKDDGTNKHEHSSSFHENSIVIDLSSSYKSKILTSDSNVPGAQKTDFLSAVNQTGPTPQPVILREGWKLEVLIPEITTANTDSDVDTTEEMQTVSSDEGSQDISVENTREGNGNIIDHTPETVSEWENVDTEESLEFSTDYAEIGETLTTESTTQIGTEEKSSDGEEGTNISQTVRNILEEITTNEPFEFTTVEIEEISTVESPDFSTQVSPLRGLSGDESLPYTTEAQTSRVQEVEGLTTERAPTDIVDNHEVKTQIRVNEETSTIHQDLPRNDGGLILATTLREPSSTESVLSTQMTVAGETTQRDVQSTVDDELSNSDDLDLTTQAILEEATTSDEGVKLITQDSEEPLTEGERTATTNPSSDSQISTVEQNRQFTGQSPSAETSTVQQEPNTTPSGKYTSIAEEDKEIKNHSLGEEMPTVEGDLKPTTNTGIDNRNDGGLILATTLREPSSTESVLSTQMTVSGETTDRDLQTTENYVPTSTVVIAEDSSTVQGDADLTTQESETTVQEQDESHTVTKEQEVTTTTLTEERNTISPDSKASTRPNLTTIIPELETASQKTSGEDFLVTEAVPELRTEGDIEEATPTIQEDFTTKTPDDDEEETSTVEEEPELEAPTTTVPPDEETSTPDTETTTELIETVTATYEAHTILDLNPPVETTEASSVLRSTADTLRRSDIEIDKDDHHGYFYPYQDLLQVMFHGMPSSTEKITSFTTENNANEDIDERISLLQHLTTNYEDLDDRSGRTLISNYKGRKDKLYQEEKTILDSSTVENDDSIYYQTETDSTTTYNPDSKFLMAVAEVQPYDGFYKISPKDTDLVFEEASTMSPTSTGEISTSERLKLNQISTTHLNTLEYPQPYDEGPNPNDHQATFSVWELLELIPVIIEELRNGHITEEEYEVFSEIFGDLWPVLVAEAKGSAGTEGNGQPGIEEMLSKIKEDREMQKLMAERHRRNGHIFENNYSPLLSALVNNRNSKEQSWRPLPGGSGITRIFYPKVTGRTTPLKRNVQPSDLETQETRNIIRRLTNIKLDTWLMLLDILSESEYFRGERDVDGSGHSEAETTYDTAIPRQKYLPFPSSEDDTEVGDGYEPFYDDDYIDDDAKITDLLAILPDPPKQRED